MHLWGESASIRSSILLLVMKKIATLLSLLLLIGILPVEAQTRQQIDAARKAQAEKEKERKEAKEKREKIKKAIEDFMEDLDLNHDKSLTLEEFIGGEKDTKSAESKFNLYNKNKDRYLSKTEIQDMLGL